MIIHTVVTSLAPIQTYHQQRRGAKGKRAIPPAPPPDMLSGGGRQVLASYTEFSYQGNFSDVACRLMDNLPHQSPAVGEVLVRQVKRDGDNVGDCLARTVRSCIQYNASKDLGAVGPGDQFTRGACMKAAMAMFSGDGNGGTPV
ncbi:unnamed protein product [Pylaiella littoralis]